MICLNRAEKQIETDKVEAKKNRRTGLPAWVLFLALAGLVGFVATMFLIPRDQAFLFTGYCIVGFGGLMSTYFGIRMIMVAFQESTTCGFSVPTLLALPTLLPHLALGTDGWTVPDEPRV